ncbi:putative RDD family membrane protein YckC [Branchiibius hedensis]|uniref:Uncharacterized membrane protein YckC, RDD family n=1 Tax=Branchiibius hedensis TaxID=672460 RepID=A0A2Y8ZSQ5_9MICO|nr:RDD family protein [Branchiibius hedensis]PWJ26103.1 putative RDD family membrane protein YckC [Branchiibius hedensis]SSA34915.1 Uncharacterized membrane protein YckC, RDD family [Branchiibius hedensis]
MEQGLRGADAGSLVSGDAVRLDIPPAGLPGRVVARLLDQVIYFAILLALLFGLGRIVGGLDANAATVLLLMYASVVLFIPVGIEVATHGRSLGKLLFKLRVVRDDGGPITFRHSLVRGLVALIEIFSFWGLPALISAALSTRGKRLGDMAAGTYVVREETSIKLTPPPLEPVALQPWASGTDIRPLPDGLALAIRQFLLRAHTLLPAARASTAANLIAQVQPYVAPPPPAGAPDEAVLAAILAERRRRDEQRLAREDAVRSRLSGTQV